MTSEPLRSIRAPLAVAAVVVAVCSVGVSTPGVTVRAEQVGVDDLKLTTGSDPRDVEVAFDSERSRHLVVWDEGVAPDTETIRGRIFDSTGTALGAAFTIGSSPVTGGAVGEPSVTFDPDGDRWWVAYTTDDSVIGEREIHVNTVTATGSVGTAFAVSSMGDDTAVYDARRPDIGYNATSTEAFVVWQGDDVVPGDGEDEIWGQRLSSSGAEVGTDDLRLSTLGTDGTPLVDAAAPQVAWNPNTNAYALVYEQQDSLVPTAVWIQPIGSTGGVGTAPSQVVAGSAGSVETSRPTVAADDVSSGFLVAWDEYDVGANSGTIRGRTFSNGGVLGSPLTLSTNGVDSQSPDLAYQPTNDRYGLVFHADVLAGAGVEYEIHGVLLTSSGSVAVPLEQLSTMGVDGTASTVTVNPAVAPAVSGRLVTVWASDNPDPSAGTSQTSTGDLEVFGQAFQPDGPPTVTIEQGSSQADPTNTGPVVFDVVFSETVTGFVAADVTVTRSGVTGGTVTVTGTGSSYTVSIAGMTGSGTIRASIAAGVATDATSNGNEVSTSTDNVVTFDAVAPSVTVEQGASQADPVGAGPVVFDVVFSESVTGFDSDDVVVGGSAPGTLTAVVSGSGDTYEVSVSGMSGDGTVTASVSADAATDAAGNGNSASTSTDGSVTIDSSGPSVTVEQAASQADPTNSDPVVFDVVFSESVSGFDADDVDVSGSTATGTLIWVVSGSGDTYEVSVSGMSGDGTVTASVPADAATDAAGNGNSASTSTDNAVTFDGRAPSVTVEQAASQADPTNSDPVVFDVVFSESVSGFDADDVDVSGSTVSGTLTAVVSGSGDTYEVSVSGMSGDGTVTASVSADAATDAAGNGNSVSTSTDNTVTFDAVAPSVTVEQGASQDDPVGAGPVVFDVVFSESVTGFDADDVVVGGSAPGTLVAVVSGSGDTYEVSVSGMSGDGSVTASVSADAATDAAGNGSSASTSTDNTVTIDGTAPSVTVEQAVGQDDPTNSDPVVFDVVFSESVSGFDADDVEVGGTATGTLIWSVAGSGDTYEVSVFGMSGDGTVVVSVPADAAEDAAGNGNEASTSTDGTVTFDGTAPSVTVEQAVGQDDPTNTDPAMFDVVFSESVTGFDADDVDLSGSTATGTLVAVVTGSGDTYEVSVSGMSGDGTVTASVSADAATDAAGNGNEASTSTDNTVTFDAGAPSVTVEQGASQADPVGAGPVVFDVVFSESVTGFDADDVVVGGSAPGTLVAVVSGSGDTYEVSVSGMSGDGTVVVSVSADAATDAAGNGNEASTSTDNTVTIDGTAPSVTVEQAVGQDDPTNSDPVVFDVVFSESVSGFDADDVEVGGTATGTLIWSVAGSGDTYEVSVFGMSGDGTVVVSVPADAAEDAAGNGNEASTSTDGTVTFDGTAPSVTVEQAASQADPTNTGPVVFDVVFSEPVTDFTASGVDVGGTAPGVITVDVAGSGDTYTVSLDGMSGPGTVTVAVAAAAAVDAAGNGSLASTSSDASVLYVPDDPNPGTNDAPAISAPSSATAERAVAVALTGANAVSVTDPDALDDPIEVTLEVTDGTITVGAPPGVAVVGDGTGSVAITGPQASVAVALAGTSVTFDIAGANTLTVVADDLGHTPGPSLSTSATVAFTVTDITAPTIGVPSVTVSVTTDPGEPGAIVTYTVTVSDPGAPEDVAGFGRIAGLRRISGWFRSASIPSVACSPESGTFFPIGITTVTCTASDATGNSSTATFLIEVLDEESPTIVGSDQTIAVTGATGRLDYSVPAAADNSGGPVEVVCDPAVGTIVAAGRVPVTCTATDPSGNSASTTFVVTLMSGVLPPTGAGELLPAALLVVVLGLAVASVGRRRRPT